MARLIHLASDRAAGRPPCRPRPSTGDGDADQGHHATHVGQRGGGLLQHQPGHHDGDDRDEVRRDRQVRGRHVVEGEGVAGEPDGRREQPEVDHPQHRGRRSRGGLLDEPPGPRQARQRPHGACHGRDLDRGQRGHQGLLDDQAHGVHEGGEGAQQHPEEVVAGVAGRAARGADEADPGDGERQPDRLGGGEPLTEEDRGEEGDHDRRALQHQGRRAGIHVPLALVEGHVVDGVPEQTDHDQAPPLPRARSPEPGECQQQQRERADGVATQRQRAGGEVVAEVSDGHEGRGPEHQRGGHGRDRQPGPAGRRAVGSPGRVGHEREARPERRQQAHGCRPGRGTLAGHDRCLTNSAA